ncbi:4-hydroxythreonine-4-phosphate dehydrogenase PdxA [Croceimicrobium hydrocarbonivorans]|uniref:4-hydroxythreonine-4-phosphate dehydrogenase PdxA n=1 Tax=Croceimicrobium hydrocarbonivorans TaxID=2761580 RepID=A0A7H0VJ26_9FLAO|nr:4-hydroxythreonine-4-phosphate dehydrogenase PdxA [Croceimicrobium hydrocarbonivorans]QNR25724.1 4-hydroxythreonine-4-phosphate dehydrogenase PdxA [Croceimicrobium hydrocarbonivorans]
MSEEALPRIGISIGDLNGVGMELIIKTFGDAEMLELCTPVVFGSTKVVSYHRNAIDRRDFNFHIINQAEDALEGKANLVNCWKEEVKMDFGKVDPEVGAYAVKSLEAACEALEAGTIDALVTAPINKESIQSKDFRFSGHTDYLESRFKSKATMMFLAPELRLALATVHVPLARVTELITPELIEQKIMALHQSLKDDFHLPKGRIAVLALNPHAGDKGVIGKEDQEIVLPAIERAKEKGALAMGPYPADSFFGSSAYQDFDMVLAMYHDQGLVGFKSITFGEGVNYSAGLPIVRTSPDHGTAFDIAGEGKADPGSFRSAVFAAIDLYRSRSGTAEMTANPLKIKGKKK